MKRGERDPHGVQSSGRARVAPSHATRCDPSQQGQRKSTGAIGPVSRQTYPDGIPAEGTVNLTDRNSEPRDSRAGIGSFSGCGGFLPSRLGSGAKQPIVWCSQAVPSKSEEVEDHTLHGQETLSLSR